MIEIYHVSDLHFGKCEEQTTAASDLLNKLKRKCFTGNCSNKYVLVTGDIIDYDSEYLSKLASTALEPFKDHLLLIPGNHDYGLFGELTYSRKAAKYFDNPFASELGMQTPNYFNKVPNKIIIKDSADQANQVIFIGLNSCRQDDHFYQWGQGEIGEGQLGLLSKILADESVPVKIIALHHIPNKDASYSALMSLTDHEKLMNAIGKRAYAIAFGHQGAMIQDGMIVPAFIRSMKKLIGNEEIPKLCDANSSVDEVACYHITISNNEPNVKYLSLKY
jgi:hypothetical protein